MSHLNPELKKITMNFKKSRLLIEKNMAADFTSKSLTANRRSDKKFDARQRLPYSW